jgi:hypothetical protein
VGLPTTDDPERLSPTRAAWHALAERVVAPVRQRATGRIGLRPAPGGFGTGPLPDGSEVRVDGSTLVVGADRTPITTLGAAAARAGLPGPADLGVYAASTPAAPDLPLAVDPGAATVLAAWFAFGASALHDWAAARADEDPSELWLWPEHFDLGLALGPEGHRANYGASPGDAGTPLPYLYVGPWDVRPDDFWDAGTYARLPLAAIAAAADPAAAAQDFFAAGRAHA